MKILLLGGTGEAKYLANALHQHKTVIYSLAGLVRTPNLPCQVISGGFSQYGGLYAYLKQHAIDLILDATHPYAASISEQAVLAARQYGCAIWRYQRAAWQAEDYAPWVECEDWLSLSRQLTIYNRRRIFLSTGQLTADSLAALSSSATFHQQRYLVRSAVPIKQALPSNINTVQGIGPFSLTEELELMHNHTIDALVSKNSGGKAGEAKLQAAKLGNVPIFMLKRPLLTQADKVFTEREACINALLH